MSESTELAAADPTAPGTAVALPSSGNVIQSILAASKDPAVDAEKVKTLHDLAVGMLDRERSAQFNRSKIAAIRAMPSIYKRGKSDKHRYAKFEDLHRAVMPVLAQHGLTLDFKVGNDGNAISVQPILRHENGWVEEGGTMKGPPDQGPGRTPIQAIGSSTSYLKRHSMKAMLNIIEDEEDDDGAYGFREGEQFNDRRQRLVLDAEAHASTGDYDGWYRSQTTKDKAWLIQAGVHARCGGMQSLPGPSASSEDDAPARVEAEDAHIEPVDETAEPAGDPPSDPTDAEAEPDPKTAEGWTTIYERRCKAADNLDDLAEIQAAGAKAIKKLETESPDLHKRAVDAGTAAYNRLSGSAGQ